MFRGAHWDALNTFCFTLSVAPAPRVSFTRCMAPETSRCGEGEGMGAPARADPKVALLGAMQSLFEASLYTFVFLWTPALGPNGERLPHGMIFACFMMACMAGSAIAGRLLANPKRHPVSHYMKVRRPLPATSHTVDMPCPV